MISIILFVTFSLLSPQQEEKVWLESFINNPFTFEISLSEFEENIPKADITSAAVKNMYYTDLNDTIYRIKLKKNVINLEKSHGFTRLKSALIRDTRIPLKGGIKIGMTKKELRNKLKENPAFEGKAIMMYNSDRSGRCIFVFKRDKLKSLKIDRIN